MISGVLRMFPVMISKVFGQDKLFLANVMIYFSVYFSMRLELINFAARKVFCVDFKII